MRHMMHAQVDMKELRRWAAERGLIEGIWLDTGHALHTLMSLMFGKGAVQPFRLLPSRGGRLGSLYGYTDDDQPALRESGTTTATPDAMAVLNPERVRTKPMRLNFEAGARLGFDVRVRPVRRLGKGRPGRAGKPMSPKGAEIDAFRTEVMRLEREGGPTGRCDLAQAGVTHERIYRDWLQERMRGAELETFRLARLNHNGGRRSGERLPDGPDAVIHGTVKVTVPEAFANTIAHGVGRHKAFGYGMLLLRPADR